MNKKILKEVAFDREIKQFILEIKRANELTRYKNQGFIGDDVRILSFISFECNDCYGYKEMIIVSVPNSIDNYIDDRYGNDKWTYLENFVKDYSELKLAILDSDHLDSCICGQQDEE